MPAYLRAPTRPSHRRGRPALDAPRSWDASRGHRLPLSCLQPRLARWQRVAPHQPSWRGARASGRRGRSLHAAAATGRRLCRQHRGRAYKQPTRGGGRAGPRARAVRPGCSELKGEGVRSESACEARVEGAKAGAGPPSKGGGYKRMGGGSEGCAPAALAPTSCGAPPRRVGGGRRLQQGWCGLRGAPCYWATYRGRGNQQRLREAACQKAGGGAGGAAAAVRPMHEPHGPPRCPLSSAMGHGGGGCAKSGPALRKGCWWLRGGWLSDAGPGGAEITSLLGPIRQVCWGYGEAKARGARCPSQTVFSSEG
jgi:hypothetical protein